MPGGKQSEIRSSGRFSPGDSATRPPLPTAAALAIAERRIPTSAAVPEELVQQLLGVLGQLSAAATSGAQRRARDLSPEAALDAFSSSLVASGKSAHTVRMYSWVARTLLERVRKPLDEISPSDLEEFLAVGVGGAPPSPSTIVLKVHALRSFFKTVGLGTARGLVVPRRGVRMPDYLSEAEVRRLLEAVAESPRDSAIMHVLAYTGIRVGELCALRADDVDAETGILRVRKGKGDKDRHVVLDRAAARAVIAWIPGCGDDRLFPLSTERVEQIVKAAGVAAGIPRRVHPHALRHSLATALLRRGCDIRFIQQLLGHSSVATTQLYTHVELSGLRDAYARARPAFG